MVFTRAHTDPCSEPDESSPHFSHHVSLRSILISSSSLRIDLPSDLFRTCYMPSPSYLPQFYNRNIWRGAPVT
jgi:hypothetical protein